MLEEGVGEKAVMRIRPLHTVRIVLTESQIQGKDMVREHHHEQQNQGGFDKHVELGDACAEYFKLF